MNKICVITGAYGAIGKAIATGIAQLHFQVFIIGRDEVRICKAANEISEKTGNKEIIPITLDLSRKSEIEAFADNWNRPLHLLINNAATAPNKRIETNEGIEMQWAVNVLGYFWMMEYFHSFMKDIDDARIVNVASYWAGGLDLKDPEFKKRLYDNDTAYRQSKQADRMLSKIFADKLTPSGISVNTCHPGDVNSKLSSDLGFDGHESPSKGAETPLWLSTSPEIKGVSGCYFEHCKAVSDSFVSNIKELEMLDKVCSA